MLDELDRKIIAAMQDELSLVSEPYRDIAAAVGITEDELFARLESYRRSGYMRRMGAVLRHRKVGFSANALCAWLVPMKRLTEVAMLMISYPLISHCYARVAHTEWPYNFYTMIHGHTRDECREFAAQLAEETGLKDYVMLFSTREWKKTSMRYFGG
ncbi:MAG: putative transcriptional regulator, AsnC family [Firmicutes bacterium]|nr:putative transcriptional regulator, AsnC family [Bacillota bacterium]